MYIKQFSRIFYYCPLNKRSSTQQFVFTASNLLGEFHHTPPIKVKISFNILPLWETLQSSLPFCKFTPMIRSLVSNLAFRSYVVCSSALECLPVDFVAYSLYFQISYQLQWSLDGVSFVVSNFVSSYNAIPSFNNVYDPS